MRVIVPACLVALALAGCANNVIWRKQGATQADWMKDSYECEKDMRQSGYFGTGLIGALNAQDFQSRCLRAHGWYADRM